LTANSFADDTLLLIFEADSVRTLGSLQTLQVTVYYSISIIKNCRFSGIESIILYFRKLLGLSHNKTALKEEHRQVNPLGTTMIDMERLCRKTGRLRSCLFLCKNELRAVLRIRDVYPGCGIFHPESRIWIFPSRIPNPDPQYRTG
jgi:hypothetical protein